jgi:glutathione synthase/RimK-type ligase-like ATP-grasp enzyme
MRPRSEPSARSRIGYRISPLEMTTMHPSNRMNPLTTVCVPGAGVPLLLSTPAHVVRARAISRDFQGCVGRPGGHDDSSCILVFTRAVDREIDELSLHLAAAGIAVVRLDADLCQGTSLIWRPDEGLLQIDGRVFQPEIVWRRYFDCAAITVPGDTEKVCYVREQWRALAAAAGPPLMRTINDSALSPHADRVVQLGVARAAGLRVPATVVSSDIAAATRILPGRGDILVKTLGRHCVEPMPGCLRGIYPIRLARADAVERAVEPAPVLVQEFVPSVRELRVYVVGATVIGYGVDRPTPEALWTSPADTVVSPTEIPPSLEAQVRGVTAGFGLDVAAVDLLDTPDGPVFLEINAECDWVWAEHAAGDDRVSRAVRDLVSATFQRRTPRSAGAM